MRKLIFCIKAVVIFILLCVSHNFSQTQTNNSISGFILDARDRSPVADIYVELLNDTYSTLKRIKTDGSGRFFFGGISSGNFKVKVLPYGTNYSEQEQDATIINNRFGSAVTSDNVYLDIYLVIDKRKINVDNSGTVGAIFVQDVPEKAKQFYKAGSLNFEKNSDPEKGFENLKKALDIYPDYYEALNKLGAEYVKRKQYYESLPHLVKAVNINKRSYSSLYMLGLAAFNLKQMKEAGAAFHAAAVLSPQSVYAQIQYGMILRVTGNYKEAEVELLKASSLSKDFKVPEVHLQLALLYEKLERFDETISELEKYLKAQPDSTSDKQIKEVIANIKLKATKNSPMKAK